MNDTDSASARGALAEAMNELRYFFGESRRTYHDPTAFAINASHFIQAGRNVTFRLQSWKDEVAGFDLWYGPWQDALRANRLMCWLKDARNTVVKRHGLEAHSTARVTVRTSYVDATDQTYCVPPFTPTADIIRDVTNQIEPGDVEYASVQVQRRWTSSDLPDEELLDAFSECLRVFQCLAEDFMLKCGTAQPLTSPGQLLEQQQPLFTEAQLEATRTMRFVPSAGKTRGLPTFKSIPVAELATDQQVRARYGDPVHADSDDPFELARAYFMPMAKRILERDGYHDPMAWVRRDGGRWKPFKLAFEDRVEKFVIWNMLGDWVREHPSDAVITIGDSWVVDRPSPTALPTRIPSSLEGLEGVREAILVHAVIKGGQGRCWMQWYHRHGDLVIWDGDAFEDDGGDVNFIEPVLAAWRDEPTLPDDD